MAKYELWCVLVLFLAQNVFAAEESCDSCVSMGGKWCHKPQNGVHCASIDSDDGCAGTDREPLTYINNNTIGDLFKPAYAERTLYFNDEGRMTVIYASAKKTNVSISFPYVAKKDARIDVSVEDIVCDSKECTISIIASPLKDFCAYHEYVDVSVNVEGFKDHATVRYYVPCTCPCTKNAQVNSTKCNSVGTFVCGVCKYNRTGDDCDLESRRGDEVENMCLTYKGETASICYGNGECTCGACKCYDNKVGSQFFDRTEHCADICTQTIECHECLRNGSIGDCSNCESHRHVTVLALNETVAATEVDEKNRKVWVHCKELAEECSFNYYATKNEEKFFVMINSNCNNAFVDKVTGAGSAKVPLILGILGLVAVVATVGGILLWKHMSALPALPLTDPQYANIDAEDCTGENPLYKPPTSSFKNPTYGKW